MKFFLTGATGFIGGHIGRQLIHAGHEVVALVRRPETAGDLEALGITLHVGDVTDKESMRHGMEAVDGVFHVAGWYKLGAKDSGPASRINVDGTRNVLQLMQEFAIPRGVYTSSLAVFSDTHGQIVDESYRFQGEYVTIYDRTKWRAHYEVALPMIEQGLPLIIVQPGVVYGPGDRSPVREMFVRYLRGRLPFVPSQTAFCWSHVEDVARAHLLAFNRGKIGESYIIAGEACTLVEVFALAERICSVPAPRIRLPPAVLKAMAGLMRVTGVLVSLPETYHHETLRASAGVTYLASNEKARRALGYTPRSLEQGLRQTLSYELRLLGRRPHVTTHVNHT